MSNSECLFCDFANSTQHTIIVEDDLAYARWDNFPVSDGHAEIIPKRHVESYFDVTDREIVALHSLAKVVKELVVARFSPDAFTIGINDGEASGRTIHHLHMHIIPRYIGDVPNPRGGVRGVIPDKKDY